MIKASKKQLEMVFNLTLNEQNKLDGRVFPYSLAPVVVSNSNKNELRMMNFSLIPSWSKDPKVKFSTHNARLFSEDEKSKKQIPIYQKPTWKSAFTSRHCLVPMSSFIEPIYSGQYAGNMVRFFEKSDALLVAVGIWEEWCSKTTGEIIESFTVLTDEPISFVQSIGHERSPVFLKSESYDEWLDAKKHKPEQWISFLQKHRADLDLDVVIDRPLAKKS